MKKLVVVAAIAIIVAIVIRLLMQRSGATEASPAADVQLIET